MRKGNSSNFQYGPDRGVSVLWAFKLDYLQPFKASKVSLLQIRPNFNLVRPSQACFMALWHAQRRNHPRTEQHIIQQERRFEWRDGDFI